ncbi:GTP cyclohydrolase II [Polynucleobacter kasalickyi]|uniref:GTP cyclohydrolase-2 n=1 Tax=Polynucleobacter kasalickyi TaxID=1938817 RepID=A0A1W2BCT0_9BURK|nr:GTP cyclohydrolase II [Polynucleobacter kasalickyi]SMC70644.1 GTP cyclohydrolase II [Polynucleobacter kasalickyi]
MKNNEIVNCSLPTEYGLFQLYVSEDPQSGNENIALVMGDVQNGEPVLTRLHSECLTGDVFHSLRCDCGPQLNEAMKMIAQEGRGVILYHREEGRGIGLLNKVKAYKLQENGADTVEANIMLGFDVDARDYRDAAKLLKDLGITSLRLITNNPKKIEFLIEFGFIIEDRIPLHVGQSPFNANYRLTKEQKMGHFKDGLESN